jgi:hypothetical protein
VFIIEDDYQPQPTRRPPKNPLLEILEQLESSKGRHVKQLEWEEQNGPYVPQ